ncbi:hypothetical protein M404DRAFT_861120 [Pisolithus tinctorius Marx 270]|uniref:Uncharacterized protein n=1 Tax=Pisolithus tinctorius Marx 270 TaxID=870435 RepID=A0A0C3IMB1_PISTI|nr:hypothetical protein M404DRAFT_861120 [Pisolithus tinctorius Marx 270]
MTHLNSDRPMTPQVPVPHSSSPHRPSLPPNHVRPETESYPDPRESWREGRLRHQSGRALWAQAQRHYQQSSSGPWGLLVQQRGLTFLGQCRRCQCFGAQAGSYSSAVAGFRRKRSLRKGPSSRVTGTQRCL